MILQVKNLNVKYRGRDKDVSALNNVSFDVLEGEILGIVGESGSGKSTFAFSLLNLLPEDSQKQGSIIFNNKDILHLNARDARDLRGNKIGLIFQDPAAAFNPVLTIGYQFEEVLREKAFIRNKQQIKRNIFDSLEKVNLGEPQRMIKSYPHQLSGGQLQRIAIAMAVSLAPALLIADEPTSSLDVTIESQIINLFRELRKHLNLTIIFITHNLDLVRALCDRVVILYKGEVREAGEVKKIFAFPEDDYTKKLLTAFKELEE